MQYDLAADLQILVSVSHLQSYFHVHVVCPITAGCSSLLCYGKGPLLPYPDLLAG